MYVQTAVTNAQENNDKKKLESGGCRVRQNEMKKR